MCWPRSTLHAEAVTAAACLARVPAPCVPGKASRDVLLFALVQEELSGAMLGGCQSPVVEVFAFPVWRQGFEICDSAACNSVDF